MWLLLCQAVAFSGMLYADIKEKMDNLQVYFFVGSLKILRLVPVVPVQPSKSSLHK